MNNTDVPIRSTDVSLQRVGNEVILHDRRNGRAHVINNSAALIWSLCDGQKTLSGIVSEFAANYGLRDSDVHQDAKAVLENFQKLDVIVVS